MTDKLLLEYKAGLEYEIQLDKELIKTKDKRLVILGKELLKPDKKSLARINRAIKKSEECNK